MRHSSIGRILLDAVDAAAVKADVEDFL